jgi:hypothetical protein
MCTHKGFARCIGVFLHAGGSLNVLNNNRRCSCVVNGLQRIDQHLNVLIIEFRPTDAAALSGYHLIRVDNSMTDLRLMIECQVAFRHVDPVERVKIFPIRQKRVENVCSYILISTFEEGRLNVTVQLALELGLICR